MQLTADQRLTLEQARADHPGAVPMRGKGHFIVVRPPAPTEWDKYFLGILGGDAKKRLAFKKLLKDTCVHPDEAGVDAFLRSLPGLAVSFGKKIAELAGLTDDVRVAGECDLSDAQREHLTAAKVKHPEAIAIQACDYTVVCRAAEAKEWDMYMDAALGGNDQKKLTMNTILLKQTCLYPAQEHVETMLEELPGIGITFGKEIAELSGLTDDIEVGEA